MLTGLLVCAAVLTAATAFGFAWRARNGRMRPAGAAVPLAARLPVTAAKARLEIVAEQSAAAAVSPGPGIAPEQPGEGLAFQLTTEDLGKPLGQRATLLQFSTAFCAPCRATRQLLADVARRTEGVAHIEIDAESRLDLVRKLGVLRTPTVFVLGPGGCVTRRASGQPRKADVLAAIGNLVT